VAAGLAVGATALAGAVTAPDPIAPAAPPPAMRAPSAPGAPDHDHGRGRMGKEGGMGMGIHGEFVVPAPGGGYQTMASQHGEVTDVSPTSITVKSEDGYTKTYAVDDGTVVEAGDNGIGDVKVGDQVGVLGVVTGDTTKAVEVRDRTAVGDRHDRWAPKGPGKRGDPGNPGEPPASPPTTVS
jgi:hypothetical protein